jgi:hypothetical protein
MKWGSERKMESQPMGQGMERCMYKTFFKIVKTV